MDVSERNFEESIERTLLAGGPDALAAGSDDGGATQAEGAIAERQAGYVGATTLASELAQELGGYHKRASGEYDRALCLIGRDTLDFIWATQPEEWEKFRTQYGEEAKERLLRRVASEVASRGTLDVLRRGVKANGCAFKLAYFTPVSGLNDALRTRYEANIFSVVRQLHYGTLDADRSLDLALFLNGLPLFTAELKNQFTGQTVHNAISQYRTDRDPREPLFAQGRCLAHFAVDPTLVYMSTHLQGRKTIFLPFNQGNGTGAGNPPRWDGFETAYLWERIWSRASVLDLIQQFVHLVDEEDDEGRKTGKRKLLFPRYHQLDAVRRLIADAREHGAGQRYLIQHSAGSGKSNTIAWLAHRLSTLHDASDRRVFDSILIITDRRVLDRQLQTTVLQFQQTDGLVENIDKTSRQLQAALQGGKTIIVTTLQKFPVIARSIEALPGQRFAIIIDEAHSSQNGEGSNSLKLVLNAGSLEEAEEQESGALDGWEDVEDSIVREMLVRKFATNASYFAFTATPKQKTLELFGRKRPDGGYEAHSLYTMRQAIEEGFILDVLQNYTTYKAYFSLLKTVADDPRYDRRRAEYLLRSYVDQDPETIRKRIEIMVEHFHAHTAQMIGGAAKAMIVTRSRLHAVRYQQELAAYLRERGYPYRALVAFSGTVRDGSHDYTEAGMNGFPESKTAEAFKRAEYRFLVVANKFQTGFDQPLLQTMYVDKKLGGVNAVQTLSRLNRVYPGKDSTMILDFANSDEEIQKAFEPYYDQTRLTEGTDPNRLYDVQTRLEGFHFYTQTEVNRFAEVYWAEPNRQDKLYAALKPAVERYQAASEEERVDFRGGLTDYVRLYAFLSQIIPWLDSDLEKLYQFARLLLRRIPPSRERLPVEIQQAIDIESYRVQQRSQGRIALERGVGALNPMAPVSGYAPLPDDMEALSAIIATLNTRFGTDFSDDDRLSIKQLEERLSESTALEASARDNPPERMRLTFEHVVENALHEMLNTHFTFYKQVTDNREFAKVFLDWLFERYVRRSAGAQAGAQDRAQAEQRAPIPSHIGEE